MSKTFLELVAADLLSRFDKNMSRVAVVFPNKRASLFLNRHFFEMTGGEPMWTPAYMTISDLFRRHSLLTVADPIKLVCDLHKTYVECTKSKETIDHFYSWGQLMLSDFDDVDKNLADADKVFRNVADIAEIERDLTYLDEEKQAILKRFFASFAQENAGQSSSGESELKKRFVNLWQHIGSIYTRFNQRLKEQHLAYEGALYRDVVSNAEAETFDEFDTYVFIGFNMLQKVEQQLFSKLKKAGKALFYWDYDTYYMPRKGQPDNEAGHFIAQYLEHFPNALEENGTSRATLYSNLKRKPHITFAEASTDTVQAAYMSSWLTQEGKGRIEAGSSTAVVMCDENILQTVMHALPDEVEKANITTGFPLQQTSVASLMSMLIDLQTNGHKAGSDKYSLHAALRVLRHPFSTIMSPLAPELIKRLTSDAEARTYYPSRQQLAVDEGTALIFADLAPSPCSQAEADRNLFAWLQKVLKHVGTQCASDDALFTESVFRMYTLVSRLLELIDSGDLQADLSTLERLFAQLIGGTSIPFHGEPIEGIQVMGVLETRNLDFEHLLILSCNEGNMPKGVNDASFIPYSIRKAYDLTTVDHKVAIYAYYFYRLLQRSADVTIISSTVKDAGTPCEKSRFMTQLMVESGIDIRHISLSARHAATSFTRHACIEKTPEIMEELKTVSYLSPTAINRYLTCQLTFYYNNLAHIHEYDDDEQAELDDRTFGLIFHAAAESIYNTIAPTGLVTTTAIDRFLRQHHAVLQHVDHAFAKELFKIDPTKHKPEYNGLQLINRAVIADYLRSLLTADKENTPFTICGLEQKVETTITINEGLPTSQTIRIGGTIDRLDAVTDKQTGHETMRVVDYKTGRYHKPSNAEQIATVDDIFTTGEKRKKQAGYYLQTLLYSLITSHSSHHNPKALPVSPALLYIQHTATDYDPVLNLGPERINDVEPLRKQFGDRLRELIADIYDPSLPFTATTDESRCKHCAYKDICSF